MEEHPDMTGLSQSEKYKAALSEHKHYDNISLVLAPGIVLLPVGSVHLAQGHVIEKLVVLLVGATLTVSVFLIYRQLSAFAGIARKVAADIENGTFTRSGPSSVLREPTDEYEPRRGFIYKMVRAITAVSVGALFLYAISVLCSA
jgi:hypothetical protein